jgi:hypothetical protein
MADDDQSVCFIFFEASPKVIMKSVKHQPKREIIDKSQPSKAI